MRHTKKSIPDIRLEMHSTFGNPHQFFYSPRNPTGCIIVSDRRGGRRIEFNELKKRALAASGKFALNAGDGSFIGVFLLDRNPDIHRFISLVEKLING